MAALKFPEVNIRQRRLLCIVYLVVVCVALLYWRFPTERVRSHLVSELNRRFPDIHITMGQINPVLPPGLNCHDVTIYYLQKVLAQDVDITVYPHWSFWLGLSSKARFDARAFGGEIDGTVHLKEKNSSADYEMVAQLNAIAIEKIAAVESIIKRPVQGILNGNITARQENLVKQLQSAKSKTQALSAITELLNGRM